MAMLVCCDQLAAFYMVKSLPLIKLKEYGLDTYRSVGGAQTEGKEYLRHVGWSLVR